MEETGRTFTRSFTDSERKKPLYRQVADVLRERIVNEVWRADDALPSRRALAKELGTTHITIDKAVSQLVKEGLLTATVGSGTYVSRRTESNSAVVIRNRAPRVGIVLGALTFKPQETSLAKEHIYFGHVLNGIQDGFFGRDVEVNYEGVMLSDLERLKAHDFDGLLVIAPSLFDLENVIHLAREWNVVVIGMSSNLIPDSEKIAAVDTDNAQGAYMATKHLIELGHREIGMVNLSFNASNHFDRHNGFLSALMDSHLKIAPEHLLMSPMYYTQIPVEASITPWIDRLAKLDRLPTAIFTCDFTTTVALLDCLKERYISVPNDISVVGYDDGPRLEHRNPPVTAVYQPTYELGKRAAERLLMILDSSSDAISIGTEQITPTLSVRGTTAQPKRSRKPLLSNGS